MLSIERALSLLRVWDHQLMEILRLAEPDRLNDEEREALTSGTALRSPVSAEDLNALSVRLLSQVPDEVICLLRVSDGFLLPVLDTESVWFLSAREIGFYRDVCAKDFSMWESELDGLDEEELNPLSQSDEEPLDLPQMSMLKKAVAMSQTSGSTTLLAYPAGLRWNYLIHSAHRQTTRFGSLEAMLEYEMERSLASLHESLEVRP
jgi:hypothetical protein